MTKKVEILAPAGDMASLRVAIEAGADAVYLGIDGFNMRQGAARNFSRESLPAASELCRARGVRLYLTLNTLVFEDEIPIVDDILACVKPCVDAVIVSDWAVIRSCRERDIPFHVSTQMSCSNSASARFLKSQGAERVVLARECTLPEIRRIARDSGIEIETFVHGAMCVAVSGRCLLSHEAYGKSGSRGECIQPCRRKYYVREVPQDEDACAEFVVTPHTVFSARDLCSVMFIDKLMDAGITAFKIEGRARNPEYVQVVTAAYRRAVDAVNRGEFTQQLGRELENECARVYHREFGRGLYHGRPGVDQLSSLDNNLATTRKYHAGIVRKYYKKARVAEILVQNNTVFAGDTISIHGHTSGIADLVADGMRRDDVTLESAGKGEWFTIPCAKLVRENDKVYIIREVEHDE